MIVAEALRRQTVSYAGTPMQVTFRFTKAILLGLCLVGFSGCGGDTATTETVDTETEAGHDHEDGDHEGHDHEGHDHEGHDHGDAKQIDASAMGLSTDDLVSLDEAPIPDNYNDAVAELATLSTKISDSIKSGAISDDHGPLHDMPRLLDGIASLGKKSSMDDDAKKAVSGAVESLMDAYTDVDYRLHDSKKGKDYADVADEINEAIKTLKSYAK